MSIPKTFVDELRARLPASEVIGKRVKITRAGREHKACCPFHNEKTPSFTINDQKGFYHCFGCGAHGDIVGFIMQHDNLSFMESIEQLSAIAGMEVPQPSKEEQARYDKQKDLYHVNEFACKWFQDQLWQPSGRQALDYLLDRGMKEETLQRFKVGFAPQDREALVKHMVAHNISKKDLLDLGLIRKGKQGEYSFFRGRIMFPVTDHRGRVVAFGGRILPLYDVAEGRYQPPKYLNSSDHDLFHKGQLLYGVSQARQAGQSGFPIILTEGYMDVIALSQAGIKGAVAPLGTALSEAQIDLMWRLSPIENKQPYLCFDGDQAGYRAAYRALERMIPHLKPGVSAQFVFMPDGEDPDTLVRQSGRKAFDRLLKNALSLFDTLWQMKTENKSFNTPESKAGLKKELEVIIGQIQDRDVQYFYKRALQNKMYEAFYNSGKKASYQNEEKVTRPFIKATAKKQFAASVLLACVINHPHLFVDQEEMIGRLPISDPVLKTIQENMINIWIENDDVASIDFLQKLYNKGLKEPVDRLLSDKIYLHAPFAKPNTESEVVLEGWQDITLLINKD